MLITGSKRGKNLRVVGKINCLVWQLNILLPYSSPTSGHMIRLHIIQPNFLNIHLNIILPFTLSECSIVFCFVSRSFEYLACHAYCTSAHTRVGTLIVTTIYLQLIQNRYMFRSFTLLQCSYQHCLQLVASDVEVVGYL